MALRRGGGGCLLLPAGSFARSLARGVVSSSNLVRRRLSNEAPDRRGGSVPARQGSPAGVSFVHTAAAAADEVVKPVAPVWRIERRRRHRPTVRVSCLRYTQTAVTSSAGSFRSAIRCPRSRFNSSIWDNHRKPTLFHISCRSSESNRWP